MYKIHSNPVGIKGIGDPFVLTGADGKYYMYATSAADGFMVWKSDDLYTWDAPVKCYTADENSFGGSDFWAPEVIYYNGKYIMHYSAKWKANNSLRIGVAVSNSPTGPFVDVYDRPMFDFGYAAIDGHVFIDDDGTAYFYYSRDCSENIYEGRHESHIYVIKMANDLLSVIGTPKLVSRPEMDFEKFSGEWRWNEGPFILKNDGIYYLMYSSNCYASKEYCLGASTAVHPEGPFVKCDNNPILWYTDKVSGPGHNSVFKTPDGKLHCAYHVHTDYGHPSGDRQMFIDELHFENGRIIIDGPTFGKR